MSLQETQLLVHNLKANLKISLEPSNFSCFTGHTEFNSIREVTKCHFLLLNLKLGIFSYAMSFQQPTASTQGTDTLGVMATHWKPPKDR